ncbi:hypothetical protein M3Y99_00925100 [Aphelenchoides fujianensis]|nr:hypothetical protein M3Y99_00925100 [Aphelenchoides fujianensis]
MEVDDRHFRCLCNTHVHRGVVIISVLGVLADLAAIAILIVLSVVNNDPTPACFSIIFFSSIVTYFILVVGNRKKIPSFYLPFLIGSIFILLACTLSGMSLVLYGTTYSTGIFNYIDDRNKLPQMAITTGAMLLFSVFPQAFFAWIVWVDYSYVKRVLLDPDSKLPRVS